MARKASLEIKEVILMVFAAIIMVSVSGLWSELYAAVYTQPDDGSIANFNRLYAAFEGMLPKADQTAQSQPTDTIKDKDLINFYLGPGKAVVFFDTDWDNKANAVEKQQAWYQFFGGSTSSINKPFSCGSSACICIYSIDDWEPDDASKRDSGVLSCRSQVFAGKNVRFYTTSGSRPPSKGVTNGDRQKIIYFGDDWSIKVDGEAHTVHRLTITKAASGSSIEFKVTSAPLNTP